MTAFLTIFGQVALLFAFSAVGFTLAKLGIVKVEHSAILSKLLVFFFLPCNIFRTFATQFRIPYLRENYEILLVALGAILVIAFASYFGSKLFSRESYERRVYEYSLAIPNSGYMGYPLAEALLGTTTMMGMMVFAVPVSFYIYIYGYARLTKSRLSPRKMINPVTVAILLGVAVGLSGITIPEIPLSFFSSAAACMGPISMLLTGIAVSEFGIPALFSEPKAYLLSIFRLLIAPLAVGGVAYLLCGIEVATVSVLYFAMPCGLNTIVFSKAVGEKSKTAASLIFVSTVLSLLTIPIVLYLFGVS